MENISPDLEAKVGVSEAVQSSPLQPRADIESALLVIFLGPTRQEILRKADKRFLSLIGLVYMLKNRDFTEHGERQSPVGL